MTGIDCGHSAVAERPAAARPGLSVSHPCLAGTGLTKHFRDVVALSSVSITLQGGSVHGLVGPNGAGKTTLIRVLIGDLTPTSGTVVYHSAVHPALPPGLGIGAATDALGLDSKASPVAMLRYLQRAAGLTPTHVDGAVDVSGIQSFASRPIGKLSTGQRKRVEIAAALLGDPECVIFDEPLNGLDPDSIDWFRNLVGNLKDAGKAILVSSHILHELGRISDHLTALHGGCVRYQGRFDHEAQDVESIYRETKEG
jgi:ABC-2 type transport system ATP-binding protein